MDLTSYYVKRRLPWWLRGKSACNAGDLGSIPGLGRAPGEKKKKMAIHSSTLVWEVSWTDKPGGLTVYEVANNMQKALKTMPDS